MQFSCFEFWIRGKKIENALIMSKNLKNDIDQVIVSTNVPLTKIPRMPLTSDNFGLLGHIQDQHYINKNFKNAPPFFFLFFWDSRMPLASDNFGLLGCIHIQPVGVHSWASDRNYFSCVCVRICVLFCFVFVLLVLFVLFMKHEQCIKANVQYLREWTVIQKFLFLFFQY